MFMIQSLTPLPFSNYRPVYEPDHEKMADPTSTSSTHARSIAEFGGRTFEFPMNENPDDYSSLLPEWPLRIHREDMNGMQALVQHNSRSSEASDPLSFHEDSRNDNDYDSLATIDRYPESQRHDGVGGGRGSSGSSRVYFDEDRAYEYEYPRHDARHVS